MKVSRWVLVGVLATAVLLFAHVAEYVFLTDDAYISFRYARNLAEGHGLVFNPGTSAWRATPTSCGCSCSRSFAKLGAPPETVAHPLTFSLTFVLWGLVARRAWRTRPGGAEWIAIAAPLLLAATRTVAVWSTSGLETRLFEVLVVGGALRLLHELDASARGESPRPIAALLFALSALTRPEGLMLSGMALGTAAALDFARTGRIESRVSRGAILWAGLAGAHFLFRFLYYGEWLPNTYYAKVSGAQWGMGWSYHACLALEYAAWLWLPLVALGVRANLRRGTPEVPLLFGAIVIPHVLYLAAIGGDHFEYRPQTLYFPFLFLLLADGLAEVRRWRQGTAIGTAWLALSVGGVFWLPAQMHRQHPEGYRAGFPGWGRESLEGRLYLRPEADPVYSLPILRSIGAAHRALLLKTTHGFVGIRQEEHRNFLEMIGPEAERLRRLVEEGVIPADAHFALDSVGFIPYVSDLRVLDRLGLTDAFVARSGSSGSGLMAHDRRATADYAREIEVDFWALDSVHSLYEASAPRFLDHIRSVRQHGLPVWAAEAHDGWFLVGVLPFGSDVAARRFPRLTFHDVRDPAFDRVREEAARRSLSGDGATGPPDGSGTR